ncbi:Glycosyl transferase, family 3 (CnaT) [Raphidiopsis brookii D9]|nr:Glycosyl transferase, family 3 (CnaT) [Raphidiopsis brookii D9]
MSKIFRQFIQKIGSGNHTSENLSRQEAYTAMKMMLLAEPTPAQIGAFLIAHRIKRPTGEELSGMLDAYDELGPKLALTNYDEDPIVFGIPYDGRVRTAPVNIITTLLLTAAGKPVIMHGGDRYPTKYGLPLVEIWQNLGINWAKVCLERNQKIFNTTGIGFIHTNSHFNLTKSLWEYREQLGKRPPLATMELIWCPYVGNAHIIAGFVHPPTEGMLQAALEMRGVKQYTFIKGLEGSTDLPKDRTAIIGTSCFDPQELKRLNLASRDYEFSSKNVPLHSTEQLIIDLKSIIRGESNELMETAIWNGAFYLWHSGISSDMSAGIDKARELLHSGLVAAKLDQLLQLL